MNCNYDCRSLIKNGTKFTLESTASVSYSTSIANLAKNCHSMSEGRLMLTAKSPFPKWPALDELFRYVSIKQHLELRAVPCCFYSMLFTVQLFRLSD